jgi:hypothetical protein
MPGPSKHHAAGSGFLNLGVIPGERAARGKGIQVPEAARFWPLLPVRRAEAFFR